MWKWKYVTWSDPSCSLQCIRSSKQLSQSWSEQLRFRLKGLLKLHKAHKPSRCKCILGYWMWEVLSWVCEVWKCSMASFLVRNSRLQKGHWEQVLRELVALMRLSLASCRRHCASSASSSLFLLMSAWSKMGSSRRGIWLAGESSFKWSSRTGIWFGWGIFF